jgi:hypothetical protein
MRLGTPTIGEFVGNRNTFKTLKLTALFRDFLRKSLAIYRSEGQYFDTHAAVSRGARVLAIALEKTGSVDEPLSLLQEAWSLHEKITGKIGSREDHDDDYSAWMFYWSR